MDRESDSLMIDANGDRRVREVLLELKRRRADVVRHSRESLGQHLRATHDILVGWRQPDRICLAGLLHSAYSTDSFKHRLFEIGERARVRELVGKDAELLVYLFCASERRELFTALRRTRGDVTASLRLVSRWDGTPLEIAPGIVGDLLVLHMANTVEQTCLADGAPSPWLSRVSELARWAGKLAEAVPQILDGCTTFVSSESEDRLLKGYAAALGNGGTDPDAAMASLASAAMEAAWVPEPLIWLGFLSVVAGDADTAAALGADAEALLNDWGSPWDKRLSLAHWRTLVGSLNDCAARKDEEFAFAREIVRAAVASANGMPERLYMGLETRGLLRSISEPRTAATPRAAATAKAGSLPARFEAYISKFRTNRELPRLNHYPGLTAQPWHDAQQFALARDLERASPEIQAELQKLDMRHFHDEAEKIRREGRWSVLFLHERGHRNDEICDLCPVTMSIIDKHHAITSLAGVSYFSCLDPGTRVAPHRGPTNMRLRCHLGLEVPDRCGLKVGGVTRTWRAAKCVVFDDNFVHEVWNLSDRRRVVLIVDMWHPDLTEEEIDLLGGLQRYAIAHRLSLKQYWEQNQLSRRAAEKLHSRAD